MMNERGKSDRSVVPGKPSNNAEEPAAETVEGRERAKGKAPEFTIFRTPSRAEVISGLERIRRAAQGDRKQRFTALLHHVYNVEALRTAYHALKRDAAAGIDGETWEHYGEALEEHLQDLAGRLQRGAYRAKPVRRAFIPKADGRLRPLGVPALEDKVVQRAVVAVLNAIYGAADNGCSSCWRKTSSGNRPVGRIAYSTVEEVTNRQKARAEKPSGAVVWQCRTARRASKLEGHNITECLPRRNAFAT